MDDKLIVRLPLNKPSSKGWQTIPGRQRKGRQSVGNFLSCPHSEDRRLLILSLPLPVGQSESESELNSKLISFNTRIRQDLLV